MAAVSAGPRYDVVVAGVGGCGSSALYHLARRGVRAVGIDRFPVAHDRGSSHGDTRVIRQAYFEHPDYVPLLRRAYELWREIEDDAGADLLDVCGLLMVGPEEGEILGGARLAATKYDVPLEILDAGAAAARCPGMVVPEGLGAVWEPMGGYLRVEDCVRTHIEQAVRRGAELRTGESIVRWDAGPDGVRVETDREVYEADRLILTPGSWAPGLLQDVGVAFEILRKVLLWYPREAPASPVPDHTFFYELPYGLFYGFPCIDGQTVKVAQHSGGTVVADPLDVERALLPGDLPEADRFVSEILPGAVSTAGRHAVCLYTMTTDGHFVIDRHPRHENVVFATGFSGHGFKFMSAMGAILSELAVDGRTESPIDFLGTHRFG